MTAGKGPRPVFAYDPMDMPGLVARLAKRADSASLPAIGLKQTLVGPEVLLELPEVLYRLAPDQTDVLLVMDRTPMKRGADSLKPLVRDLLAAAGWKVLAVELQGDTYVLALETGADLLLIDERIGRETASHMGLRCMGLIGLLILAKRRGLIDAMQPYLDARRRVAGFRVDDLLYQRVLTDEGEI